uniref:protein-tyrosine-phosphatase n=1 Tax=Electrophorus electricus TaxID=8005 RepID=A0A4W4DYP9_ELEEL
MPPLPLDERIVVIQRPKNLALRVASPPTTSQSSSRLTSRNKLPTHSPQPQPPLHHPCTPFSSLSLECRHRPFSRIQKAKDERGTTTEVNSWIPSHCHSNGSVTLGPRPPKHTHNIDIKVSVDKGGTHSDKGLSSSLTRGGSVREGRGTKHLEPGQGDWQPRVKSSEQAERYQNQNKTQHTSHHQNQLAVSPGGVLEFIPAQRQQSKSRWIREDLSSKSHYKTANNRDVLSVGNKENSKLGPAHQPPNPHSLPHYHGTAPTPHASILNTHYPAGSPSVPFRATSSFQYLGQTRPSRAREQHPQILHSLPLSPTSLCGGFPSPDHTCTINFSRPFNCGCWRLVRGRGGRGHSADYQGASGSPSSSFSQTQRISPTKGGDTIMGLKTLGGCLSTASTTNTSSSNSTVSDCRTGLLRPLRCTSCSGEGGSFESPTAFRKKLVGGCLPCAPLSSSAPLRALQSCVSGCNPKASQAGSSSCSYCSSDPIVVTFNPHRGKPPNIGHSIGTHTMGGYQHDDDDYSVRTIWPEELAKKMTRSKTQSSRNGTNPVILDCQNLLEFTRSQLTDHAGRRRLQQGKMAVLDFMGSGSSRDPGRDSLKRLWNKGADREGGHSLPSAQSLHLVLNPLNREQDEENGRGLCFSLVVHLSLPLSSSLPASLSDESIMTPDVENAVVSPILPFLFLGNERDAQDLDLLLRLNVSYVVNVTTHLPLYHVDTGLVRYKRLPATDNSKQNLRQYFEEVFEFIEEAHQSGRGVLVHCQAGVSRSATIVIAYLMKHTLMTMTDAYKYVRSRRPVVSPNLNFMGQLLEFERDLNSGVTPRILTPKLSGLETQV